MYNCYSSLYFVNNIAGVVIGIHKDSFEKETTYPLLLTGCALNIFLILSYSFLLSKFDKNKEGTCNTLLNIICDGSRLSISNDSGITTL